MSRRLLLLVAAILIAGVGTALIFVYVRNANNRALANEHPQAVLVAKLLIPAGTSISAAQGAGDLQTMQVPRSAVATGALSTINPLAGEVALTAIYPGEEIVSSEFGTLSPTAQTGLDIPKGDVAISVQLGDPNRVAGFVDPGDDVAVFAQGAGSTSGTSGTSGGSFARLLMPKVEVLAVGQTTVAPPAPGRGNPEAIPRTLMTLAVTQSQAERIILAQANDTLWFALLGPNSTVKPDRGVTTANLFP
jgi:pilus assembly protein CpaB